MTTTTERPWLLDLYCGAGGAARGYHDAGFDVVGVDLHPQPNYPYIFYRHDVLELSAEWLSWFAVVHASAPCQAHSTLKARHRHVDHPDLIAQTRELLLASGRPYVMENVPGAPLINPLTLCGSMFDLSVKRHRLFESNVALAAPACNHDRWAELWPDGFHRDVSKARVAAGAPDRSPVVTVAGNGGGPGKVLSTWRSAMGIDWMTKREIAQAIPPAYTRHIGAQLIEIVR